MSSAKLIFKRAIMETPWKPEITVSIELAKTLIDEQFPKLHLTKIENFGEGWDNTAFLVNERYVFRFPRRQIAVELLRNELKILPFLKDKLLLHIPFPEFKGEPTEKFPWPFAGYVKLSGTPACYASMSIEDRYDNAETLAKFLATLHAIPLDDIKNLDLQTDSLDRIDLKKRIPMTLKNLQLIEIDKLFTTLPLQKYIENITTILNPDPLCLTQGDFYAKHILVNEQKKITGVIDWGDSELGYPALDLSIAHSFLPPQAHDLFRKIYGSISDATWELARLRAIYSLSYIILYGTDMEDNDLISEGLTGLHYISQSL